MKKAFSYLLYSIYTLIILGLIVLFIAPPLPVIGELDVKIVKSGSMEPSIMTGAVVVVREALSYGLQDVITFASAGGDIPTTHRIIGTESVNGVEYFITKGDANEERDTNLVSPADILGKVMLDVPFVGFVLDFARQPVGFALLVGVPALIIIIDEITKIWGEIRKRRGPDAGEKEEGSTVVTSHDFDIEPEDFIMPVSESVSPRTRMMDIKPIQNPIRNQQNTFSYIEPEKTASRMSHDIRPRMMTATFGVLMMCVLSGQAWVSGSIAYVVDTETAVGNSLVAQVVDFEVSPSNSEFTVLDGVIAGVSGVDVVATSGDVIAGELVYSLSSMSVGGNVTMCDDVSVVTGEPLAFAGALTDIAGSNIMFSSPWHLDFTLSGSNVYSLGERCDIALVFDGYLNDVDGVGGYTDTETINLAFVSAGASVESTGPSAKLQAFSIASASSTPFVTQSLVEEKTPPQAGGGGNGGNGSDGEGSEADGNENPEVDHTDEKDTEDDISSEGEVIAEEGVAEESMSESKEEKEVLDIEIQEESEVVIEEEPVEAEIEQVVLDTNNKEEKEVVE